jgi:hypothetical protein
VDSIPPVITCPSDRSFECDDPIQFGQATATDNCDTDVAITFGDQTVPGGNPGEYQVVRTWTATDDCGNVGTCRQTVTVTDDTPPVITCPGDRRISCEQPVNFGEATAVDYCDPDPDITHSDQTIPGSCAQERTIVRTWFAEDASGNSSSCVQTVTVYDETPPEITCPTDRDFEVGQAINFGEPTVSDNCDTEVDVGHSDRQIPGDCPQEYTIIRTWTATDDCGNAASCDQTITVHDNTPPVITCPSDRTFECSQPIEFGQPTASDNCDTQLTITFSDEVVPGSNPESYQIRRTWRAVDDCQNSATCMQIVTVTDRTPPVITCPGDRTFQCNQPVEFGQATATDNCDTQVTITSSDQTISGTSPQNYQIRRTWVVRDASGNSSTCIEIVRVIDTVGPVLTPAPDLVLPCNAPVEFTNPQISDNCDPQPRLVVLSTSVIPGTGPCEYTHIRCWVAYDATGNSSSQVCQRITRMEDTTPPVLTCVGDKTIQAGEPVIFDEPAYSDNCPAAATLQSSPPVVGGVTADGDTVYTQCWIAFDGCGNQSNECCQNITVQSGPAPAESCSFVCWDWSDACLEGPNRPISTTPACVRDDHFRDVFPNGLMVGKSNRYHVVWTSAAAVENFKCGYGLPFALTRNYTDPQRGLLGSIYGEILALRLNREFSCGGYFEDFAGPGGIACFGSVVVPPEVMRFSGLTVDQLLAVADAALSGDKTALLPYGNSMLRLQAAAGYMNWLFGDCGGHGTRPEQPPFVASGTLDRFGDGQVPESAFQPLPEKFSMTAQPNPLRGSVVISLALPVDGSVAIEIYDIQGRKVATPLRERVAAGYRNVAWNGTDDLGAPVVPGVYFCRVQIDGQIAAMQKLMKL